MAELSEEESAIELNLTRPNLSQHYLNANTADVFFVCSYVRSIKIPAHKIILASVSSVFQTMFYSLLQEKEEIELPDVTAAGLKQFLHLFYNTKVNCSIDHVHEVLYLSEKYDVPDYAFLCCKFLIENGRESFQTENFLRCSQAVLRVVLQNMYLKGEGEVLFKACIDWAANACVFYKLDCDSMENRLKVLGNCLDLIEFASIKQNAAIDYVNKYHGIFTENQLRFMLQLIAKRLPAVHYGFDHHKWPIDLTRTTQMLQLKKGQTHTMELEIEESFLLHDIGFNIPATVSNQFEKFTLLLSIEKTNFDDENSKMKIFFGRLSFKKVVDSTGCSIRSTLPDIILFDDFSTYSMEITPFEDIKIQCYDSNFSYDGLHHSIFQFDDPYAVLLRITKM